MPVHTTRSKRAEAPLWVTVRSDRRKQNEKIGKGSLHKVLFFMRKKKIETKELMNDYNYYKHIKREHEGKQTRKGV